MYKANLELFTVKSNFNVKFCLILKGDDNEKDKFGKLVNKFAIAGNEYLNIMPFPFILFDISSKKERNENGYSAYDSISLNKKNLFFVIKKIEKLLKDFTTPDLFYYDEKGELKVNPELVEKFRVIHKTNSKTMVIQPAVVYDEKDDVSYEGCILAINSFDHSTEITYAELQFLHHELTKIDMTDLSMQILSLSSLIEKIKLSNIDIPKLVEETIEAELVDIKKTIGIEDKKEIPDEI
jgi:hypothetical protein